MTISSQTRKAGPYNGNGSTTTFPFAFKVFQASDVLVVRANASGVETVLTLGTDYTVSLNANQDSNAGGNVVMATAPASGYTLTIGSKVPLLQQTDFTNQGGFYPKVLNASLDKLTILTQQLQEEVDRSAKLPISNSTDADALVADIIALANDKANLDLVAGDLANIDAVAGNKTNIDTVATNNANVTAVGANISNVNAVAANETNINAVKNNATNINTVAGISANVTTVAGISANVTTVAGISSNVTSVAGNATNITAVAGNATNINAVNANKTNIDAVAGNATNINAVNANKTNIDTAATNIAAIIDAPNQASAAAASAAAAAASAASGMYSAVQDKSASYTVVAADAGDLIRVNTSAAARTITLPQISGTGIGDGFKIAVVKWTADGNAVTIARSGSDTINGATSYTLGNQYSSATFVADGETNTWFAAASGLGTTNANVDVFSGNGSTTAFTLSGDAGAKNNTAVMIGGVYQAKSTYSLSGTTLTFSSAPPSGTSNIEVVWNSPLAIGTPSDDTVSTAKLQAGAVTPAKVATGVDFTFNGLTVGKGAGSVSTNTAVGASALAANTTGSNNTAVGSGALDANQDGYRNTAVGVDTLGSNISGNSNTAVGFQSQPQTTANQNSSFGYRTLYTNVDGAYNTAIGTNALNGNTSGNYNSAMGVQALQANTTASNNTAVGYQAAYTNSTGSNFAAFGLQAAYLNTTGASFAAFGVEALYSNTTGNYNTALGRQALYSNTTANGNTAVGYQAGYSNTTGGVTAVGFYALNGNTTGINNAAVGDSALRSNTTGGYNTAMGVDALRTNTVATENTAVGFQSLSLFNRTSDALGRNAAFGKSALYNLTTGYENAAFGTFAGYTNSQGAGNTFIGEEAGYYSTGSYNCFVGYAAGNAVTTGAKNTILGKYSGNQGGLDIRTANNYIVLSDGDGNPRMWANGALWYIPDSANFRIGSSLGGSSGGIDFRISSTCGRADWYNDAGVSRACQYFYYSGVEKGSILISSTATAYVTSSDYRLKNSVAPMTGALAKVAQLKPCTYKWNSDGSDGQGFIAHELQAVVPQCVTGEKDAVDADGNPVYQGIDTSFLVATLTAAIQEQQAIIEQLKARLDAANL